jgi:hypothetical protein
MKGPGRSVIPLAAALCGLSSLGAVDDAAATPDPRATDGAGTPNAGAEVSAAAGAGAETEDEALARVLGAEVDSAIEEEPKLSLYGFTDFSYAQRLNSFTLQSPYPTFMVGNVNLYVGAELGKGWRSLTEFRLLYVPHGTVPTSQQFAAEPQRSDTTVPDPADYNRPLRWGGVEIERAWLEWSADALLTVRAGQWLTPYGIWNVDHGSPVIIGVRRPYVVGEALIPEHQTGLLLYGSYLFGTTELGYDLGLSNGRGPVDAYQDLDNNKAVTLRMFVTSESPLGTVTLGGTLYRGRYTDRSTRTVVTATGDVGAEYISTARYEELGLSADLRWLWNDLVVQGELIVRDVAYDDRLRPAALPAVGAPVGFVRDYRSLGWYAMAAYHLPWNLTPFFGGENYDTGQDLLGRSSAVWGGLNFRPVPRVVLKAQLTDVWFGDDSAFYGDDDLQVLDLQAAWSF